MGDIYHDFSVWRSPVNFVITVHLLKSLKLRVSAFSAIADHMLSDQSSNERDP